MARIILLGFTELALFTSHIFMTWSLILKRLPAPERFVLSRVGLLFSEKKVGYFARPKELEIEGLSIFTHTALKVGNIEITQPTKTKRKLTPTPILNVGYVNSYTA